MNDIFENLLEKIKMLSNRDNSFIENSNEINEFIKNINKKRKFDSKGRIIFQNQ